MQNWKIVITGITGDLAKRKILPAIGEFSNIYQNEVQIDLVGYSRHNPNLEEIQSVLNSKAESKVQSINLVTGNYNDSKFFAELFANNSNNARIVVYFAVPPQVFLDLLENLCPYGHKNLDIIIEKPFGQDEKEAELIIRKIESCKLQNNVHFCDHYLFKNGLNITEDTKLRLRSIPGYIKTVKIKALETIDISGRGGYYEGTGAIKDMIPAHFYSLIITLCSTLDRKFDFENFKVLGIKLGQYKGYLEHVGKDASSTETYFDIKLESNGVFLELESGKKLDKKETSITVLFHNGNKIYWRIDPNPIIKMNNEIVTIESNLSDHTKLFADILNNQKDRFLTEIDTLSGWRLYTKIKQFIQENRVTVEIY